MTRRSRFGKAVLGWLVLASAGQAAAPAAEVEKWGLFELSLPGPREGNPYNKGHWGFDRMAAAEDYRYLNYVVCRLAAFRNVWRSLANEFDFMEKKSQSDWDRLFRVVHQVNRPDQYYAMRPDSGLQ